MTASRKLWCLKSRVQHQVQRFAHSFVKAREVGHTSMSKCHCKKLDSRSLGITLSMIPDSSRIVLKILQNEGYDAYLVGGCVRDLLLNKVPKDFDVITSANLQEIKKKFHRAYIVGRKFPICRVHVRGSAIEVSSFETVAKHASKKEEVRPTMKPEGYDAKDFLRWRNSLHRDFTINSLFYDPFAQRIYDYSNGMTDLRSMKLRTVVPALLSFEEDCARILRGIRVAARLGFTFAKDTEKALCSLYNSVTTLDKARLMMEMNYMLSYGAAERSFILLKKFNILELLLPFEAAYLSEHSGSQIPVMLMKLFSNLDRITSCDQPCNSGLWVSLLAFHLALVNNPQDAIVVWTFSSLLYHGNWKEGVKAARELSAGHVHFKPEIYNSSDDVTDEELSVRVATFASVVQDSIDMLIDSEGLRIAMLRYPFSPSSHLIWISKNAGKEASAVFNVLMKDIELLREERCYSNIDYSMLGKGDLPETRFALGKIIMDTLRSGVIYGRTKLATEKDDDLHACSPKIDVTQVENKLDSPKCKDGVKQGRSVLDNQKHQRKAKKQKVKMQTNELGQKCVKDKSEEILSCQEIAQKRQQLKKVMVKDVKNLLSLQEAAFKNFKVELEKHCEAQTSKKVLKMVSHRESDGPEETKRVSGKVTGIRKRRMAQAPEKILSVLGKLPQLKTQQKEPLATDMVNVTSLSDIFKGDKYSTNKDDREVKQATVGDRPQDEFIEAKKAWKLSSIFK
ncbi:hypothetical protein RND81_13G219700 [Saponaria officinalis]|uniref:Uncharacterized protein n=1 Tax=Saponaria officinalis TaxID=3572 RepID=A0AAW1H3F2_SAPOF